MTPASNKQFIPFRPAEKKVFRRKRRLPGHQWAEKNINVPVGSRQGLYRNNNNPAMHGVLDWSTRPTVRTVVMAKGIQVGGTLIFYSLLLREAEYSADSALIVMADERSVKKLSKKRLQPMIDKSPALAAIKSANPDDTTIYSITLGHGFTIDIGWASSEMSVSSESYRIVLLDEISKYKTRGNIEDAKSRATVFPDTKKVFIWSSPGIDTDDPNTRDPLMVEAENCDVMLDYHVICPDCGGEQVMVFEQFKYPGQTTLTGSVDADPRSIRRNKSAYYECAHCSSRWNDYKRDRAVLAAMKEGWKPTDPDAPEMPQSVYFHFPSWLSPFVSLSDVVADWLEAQADVEKLRKWYNKHAAISYRYETQDRIEDQITRLVNADMPREVAPRDPAALILLADTQRLGFHYEVWAYGWGRNLDITMIDHGYLENFDDLDGKATQPWLDADGKEYRISAAFIDSGGGTNPANPKHSRTAEVYEFCRTHRLFRPLKGRRDQNQPWNATRIDHYPSRSGKKIPIPGGLTLYTINVTLFKNDLARKLQINPGDPGGMTLHAQTGSDYAQQMCAEYQDERGYWQCPKNKPNHHWDIGVYGMAAAEILQIKNRKRPEIKTEKSPRPPRKPGFVSGWKK